MKAKGIRTLGELRKQQVNKGIMNYMILDKNDESKFPLPAYEKEWEEALYKYGNHSFMSIGISDIKDPDDKLIEPDYLINGTLAYNVFYIDAFAYISGANGYHFYYVDINGKEFSYEEVEDATNTGSIIDKRSGQIENVVLSHYFSNGPEYERPYKNNN